jgi:hypothetical protein
MVLLFKGVHHFTRGRALPRFPSLTAWGIFAGLSRKCNHEFVIGRQAVICYRQVLSVRVRQALFAIGWGSWGISARRVVTEAKEIKPLKEKLSMKIPLRAASVKLMSFSPLAHRTLISECCG